MEVFVDKTNTLADVQRANFRRLHFAGLGVVLAAGLTMSVTAADGNITLRGAIEEPAQIPAQRTADVSSLRLKLKPRYQKSITQSPYGGLLRVTNWNRESQCLATALYFEARGESELGQKAVAEVIMTRAGSGRYPGSICGVVYQGSHRHLSCQFTFTCDGIADRPRDRAAWEHARRVAATMIVQAQDRRPITNWATHYHANYVNPRWASKLTRTARVGTHIFYRDRFAKRSA
jgi:hypothetical protein